MASLPHLLQSLLSEPWHFSDPLDTSRRTTPITEKTHTVYGFFRKFFYPKSSLILVYMGLRFFPLSFGGSCPNTRSISKRFIFLQGYLARGTFSGSTLTRNCYCLYHFLLANLSCHVFLQHFPLVCELPFISCNLFVECVTEIFNFYVMP